MTRMADREDKVYKAKLAEQAERYDGEYFNTVGWLAGGLPGGITAATIALHTTTAPLSTWQPRPPSPGCHHSHTPHITFTTSTPPPPLQSVTSHLLAFLNTNTWNISQSHSTNCVLVGSLMKKGIYQLIFECVVLHWDC